MTGNIFVSYRRADSKHLAGRIVDRLTTSFGKERLFLDVDSIDLGLDFVEVLNDRVARCEVMLVVIGPDWLDMRDAEGNRRLENPNDFVRIEVEAALSRDIRVIPILADGAEPVRADELPDSLDALAQRQALRVDHESFAADTDRLIESLSKLLDPVASDDAETASLGRQVSQDRMTVLEKVEPNAQDEDFDALGWFAVVSPVFFTVLLMLLMVGGGMHAKDFAMLGLKGSTVFFAAPLIASVLVWVARISKAPPPGTKLIWGIGCFLLVLFFAGLVT